MNSSEKRTHEKFQSQCVSEIESEADFKRQGSDKSSHDISNGNQSKESTQNGYRKQSDYLNSIQDESQITSLYDLQQLNYRVFMNQDYERSLKIQKILLERVERSPEYYIQSSISYLALNDLGQAEYFYNRSNQFTPFYNQFFFDFEIAKYIPETFRESIKYIQNNITCYKDKENQLIADCFFAYHIFVFQRPEKAIKMLMLLMKRYPQSYLPYYYASKCYFRKQEYSTGLECINQAIINFPYKDIHLYNLKGTLFKIQQGQFLIQMGDYNDALRVYSIFPNNEYFRRRLIEIKNQQEQRELERQKIQNQQNIIQPGKLEKEWQEQGINFYYQRQYELAKDSLLQAIKENQNNGQCQYVLAKCYLKLGDLDNALNHSEVAFWIYENPKNSIKLQKKIICERNRFEKKRANSYLTIKTAQIYYKLKDLVKYKQQLHLIQSKIQNDSCLYYLQAKLAIAERCTPEQIKYKFELSVKQQNVHPLFYQKYIKYLNQIGDAQGAGNIQQRFQKQRIIIEEKHNSSNITSWNYLVNLS